MNFFAILASEARHFKTLSESARRLFFSSIIYEIANPIAFLFTNAYLFRSGETNLLVILYNFGTFIGLPLGFYLNGYLLRHVRFSKLFAIGFPLQGLTSLSLFFISALSGQIVFAFGVLFGLAMAIYWGNRNYLSLLATSDEQRAYYGGMEGVMSTYVGIIVPFAIGIGLSQLPTLFHVEPVVVYRLFALLALIVQILGASIILPIKDKNPVINKVILLQSSRQWTKVRILEIILGIENGLGNFLPSLIILTLLGGVSVLGSLSSLSAILGSLIVYSVSRRVTPTQRASRLFLFTIMEIILAALYAIFFSKIAAGLLIVLTPSLLQLKWPLQQAQVSKTLNDEENGDTTNDYAYVSDEELFLNIGRVVGVGIFLLAGAGFTDLTILRIIPVVLAITQLGVVFIVYNLSHHSYTLNTNYVEN